MRLSYQVNNISLISLKIHPIPRTIIHVFVGLISSLYVRFRVCLDSMQGR